MTEQNDKEYYNSTALESIDRIAYQARLSLERYKDQSSFERVERLLENDINIVKDALAFYSVYLREKRIK